MSHPRSTLLEAVPADLPHWTERSGKVTTQTKATGLDAGNPTPDELLGVTALILAQEGAEEAAHALRQADVLWWDDDSRIITAYVELPASVLITLDENAREQIQNTLGEIFHRTAGFWPHVVLQRTIPSPLGWREQLDPERGGVNQLPRSRKPKAGAIEADRLYFRSSAELRFYRILKNVQESRPRHDTFTIIPNTSARVSGKTLAPDFLICYRGRVAAVEIDGPTHRGKYSNDLSRDRHLQYAGVPVERLDAEDMANAEEVTGWLQGFLDRLLQR